MKKIILSMLILLLVPLVSGYNDFKVDSYEVVGTANQDCVGANPCTSADSIMQPFHVNASTELEENDNISVMLGSNLNTGIAAGEWVNVTIVKLNSSGEPDPLDNKIYAEGKFLEYNFPQVSGQWSNNLSMLLYEDLGTGWYGIYVKTKITFGGGKQMCIATDTNSLYHGLASYGKIIRASPSCKEYDSATSSDSATITWLFQVYGRPIAPTTVPSITQTYPSSDNSTSIGNTGTIKINTTITDDNDVNSVEINITEGSLSGTERYNQLNTSISGLTFNAIEDIDTTSWNNVTHIYSVRACDNKQCNETHYSFILNEIPPDAAYSTNLVDGINWFNTDPIDLNTTSGVLTLFFMLFLLICFYVVSEVFKIPAIMLITSIMTFTFGIYIAAIVSTIMGIGLMLLGALYLFRMVQITT